MPIQSIHSEAGVGAGVDTVFDRLGAHSTPSCLSPMEASNISDLGLILGVGSDARQVLTGVTDPTLGLSAMCNSGPECANFEARLRPASC
jgi:hypothetical protein